jgi:hypothetical protein
LLLKLTFSRLQTSPELPKLGETPEERKCEKYVGGNGSNEGQPVYIATKGNRASLEGNE